MPKIGTHNSGTGEKGSGLLSWLVAPFSKCQSKTLIEQYKVGCRYFDIRIRFSLANYKYVLSHGLWESKEDAIELLINLDKQANEDYYIAICYEDTNKEANVFKQHIENTLRSALKHAKIVYYASKKPKWQVIKEYMSVPCVQHFKVLDFSSWHTLIPIPWLWKKLYYNKPQFNTEVFKLVDFL